MELDEEERSARGDEKPVVARRRTRPATFPAPTADEAEPVPSRVATLASTHTATSPSHHLDRGQMKLCERIFIASGVESSSAR